ncbi:MAG: NERD domain-containing protein [Aphanocapsa lilacina HA4352-LM1]|nr:NERD domain-containing protein [Aphanocapsa lilacina HA4352-LM1]
MLCDRGIFVIEGKCYPGTIRGGINSVWKTATGNLVKSSRGNNPVQQCEKQTMALKDFFSEYGVFVNGAVVFPQRAKFDLDHVQINALSYSSSIPVFNESALVTAINKHRPPTGKTVPSQTVLRQMADRIMKV